MTRTRFPRGLAGCFAALGWLGMGPMGLGWAGVRLSGVPGAVRGARLIGATMLMGCLALAALAGGAPPQATAAPEGATLAQDRISADRASRSYQRPPSTEGTGGSGYDDASQRAAQKAATDQRAAAQKAAAQKAAAQKAAAQKVAAQKVAAQKAAAHKARAGKAAAPRAARAPRPVAGLSQVQMNNAARIVAVGRKLGLPKRAYVLAVACAMQESTLRNLASRRLPESLRYPHEGSGADHDSVGLFQQRPSSGWGSVRNLMNAEYASTKFYKALVSVPGWQRMQLTYAIQAVQVSAYPRAYAKHEWRAKAVVEALT